MVWGDEPIVARFAPSSKATVVELGDAWDEGEAHWIPSENAAPVITRQVQAVAEPNQPNDPLRSGPSFDRPLERSAFSGAPAASLNEPSIARGGQAQFEQKDLGAMGTSAGGGSSAAVSSAPVVEGSATLADVSPPSAAPASDSIRWSEIPVLGADDAGSLLQQSSDVQTVRNQRRSPVAFDPRVRAFHGGQLYTQGDGAWWTPVRADLDTMLSKIDPGLLENVTVIPGPYGLRYGPGLAYLHVETAPTPRYEDCFQIHNRSGITVHPNGGQIFGRETILGGSDDWGFVFNYGHRVGSDYQAGNGLDIPASYRNVNYWGQLGVDLDSESRMEFRFGHLDQGPTQYAGQFFDINSLTTNSFALSIVKDEDFQRSKIEAWYNDTGYDGDTQQPGKRPSITNPFDPREQAFHVINRVERALESALGQTANSVSFVGNTLGELQTGGVRGVITYGETDGIQLSMGTDFRSTQQRLAESFLATAPGATGPLLDIDTNQPLSQLDDVGAFTELVLPMAEWWTVKGGTRIDSVATDVREPLRADSSLPAISSQLNQRDNLFAFYVTSDAVVTDHADLRLGLGRAERPPTLTERYADGVFLGIIQNGFSRVIGNPSLALERSWQVDMTVDIQYERLRGRMSGYHAWVQDYITYEGNLITDPVGARLLVATNTDLATIAGFETYTELDLTRRLTAFGSISYVEGRDRTLGQMLPGMYPLESTIGLRLVDQPDDSRRGVEFGARIVNDEDRIGIVRVRGTNGQDTVAVEDSTPGFTVLFLRGYWNVSDHLHFVAGVDNLGDRNYYEHLNLRLPADDNTGIPALQVLSPGISPYFGAEWTF